MGFSNCYVHMWICFCWCHTIFFHTSSASAMGKNFCVQCSSWFVSARCRGVKGLWQAYLHLASLGLRGWSESHCPCKLWQACTCVAGRRPSLWQSQYPFFFVGGLGNLCSYAKPACSKTFSIVFHCATMPHLKPNTFSISDLAAWDTIVLPSGVPK